MRNKIFTILGILLIVVAVGSYFLFDANIKQNSQAMGSYILVAKKNIPEGTVIKNENQAKNLFEVRRIAQAEIVPSSIKVDVVKMKDSNFLNRIKNTFTEQSLEISQTDLNALVNKKVLVNVYKNQQILNAYLSENNAEFEESERYFAVPTSYIDAVGAEISKDDYVDLWVHYGEKHDKEGVSEKIIEALKVVKVKGANNEEVKGGEGVVPAVVVFKMNEEQITLVSQKMYEGSLFLTKWGIAPKIEPTIVVDTQVKISKENENGYANEEIEIESEHIEEREVNNVEGKETTNNKEGASGE